MLPGIVGFAGMVGGGVAEIVGTWMGGSTLLIAWPAGTVAGDFAVIVAGSTGSTGTVSIDTGGWTELHAGDKNWRGTTSNVGQMFYKTLTSTDISSPPTVSDTATYTSTTLIVYRNCSDVVDLAHVDNETGSDCTFGGIVKPAGCKFLHTSVFDRTAIDATAPSGFTDDGYATNSSSLGLNLAHIAADDYTDSDAIAWTGMSGTYGQGGYLVAVT